MARQIQNHLVLTPNVWRELLCSELVDAGLPRDTSDLVARRVIECLLRAYLTGRVDAAPSTQALDEAA